MSEKFHKILDKAVSTLTIAAQKGEDGFDTSRDFQKRVLKDLRKAAKPEGLDANESNHPHAFPDLIVNGYGIEVKHTRKDSWLAVGNSIFEGMRDETAEDIYVVFGKMGGWPEVRWARYEDCITHVRISHAPRFVVEMEDPSRLFNILGITYEEFRNLSPEEKMIHVREYARGRLKEGERLWWLEDQEEPEHSLPIQVRLYRLLPQEEKRQLRGEAALLCPSVFRSSRQRGKYDSAAIYLLTHHGVFAPQLRDLFSAGSVAEHVPPLYPDEPYVSRAMRDIESHIVAAAFYLDDNLFDEYWGFSCPPKERIAEWLKLADGFATDWQPSKNLFLEERHRGSSLFS